MKRERPPRCPATRKGAWPNEIEAAQSALRVAIRTGKPIRTYQCPLCAAWHLTSRPDRYEQQRRTS